MWFTAGWDPITVQAWSPTDVVWPIWSHSDHSAFCMHLHLTFTCVFSYWDRISKRRSRVNSRCKWGVRVRVSLLPLLRFWPFFHKGLQLSGNAILNHWSAPPPFRENKLIVFKTGYAIRNLWKMIQLRFWQQQLLFIFRLQFLRNACLMNS